MNEISQIAIADKPGRMQFFEPTPVSESATMLQVIANAASNPAVDVAKMEQLFALQAQIAAREAKVAFASELAEMQRDLPTIDRNGRIEIKDKDNVVKQSTAFADWADINEAIKPILGAHGFSLSFRTATAPDGKLRITAILRHKQGHEEETYMDLMHDSTGSKNAVQAVGSSMTYGKRYTACAILNITSRAKDERDTDGKTPEASPQALVEEGRQIALADGATGLGVWWTKTLTKEARKELGPLVLNALKAIAESGEDSEIPGYGAK